MRDIVHLYRKVIVPATLALAGLGLAAAAIILTGPAPAVSRVSPESVRAGLALGLLVLGVVLPLLGLLVRTVRNRGHLLMAVVFLGAMTVHAASLNDLVRTPVQAMLSVIAVVVSLLLILLTLVVVGDARASRPVTSKLKG